eukprot:g9070.t1
MSSRKRSRSTNAGATDKRKSSASPQVVRQTATTPTSANKTPVPSAKKSLLHVFCTDYWGALVYYLGFGFGDSLCRNYIFLPRVPLCYVVNAFKGATLFFCCFLMHYFDNYSPTNCVYTALHGSYGVLWCLKELWCPDVRFQQPVPLGSALMAAVFCGLYWLAPVVLISRPRVSISPSELDLGVEPPYNKVAKFRDAACVFTYVIGVCMMLVADTHKFIALKYADSELVKKKKLLISDGIFYSNRNPNYLGEMLLYGSFAVVSLPIDVVLGTAWFSSSSTTEPGTETTTSTSRPLWIELSPLFVLAFAWLGLFSVNMFQKESSLMKKPGYAEYKKRSWLFLPKLM